MLVKSLEVGKVQRILLVVLQLIKSRGLLLGDECLFLLVDRGGL